ncbi:hypothetical protein TNIN_112301 [Trichonephila inaurata madagascariensis]|uniref:Uncharacterized protein n=1 Tax=Trichonephila inaurata madagascariensis TaxID=2747483 RepID=A0A8X6Y8I9_9ARAC|nr:hypothetical protein TNIN_112301 [Trichonephila inaurata madagascariensis]
MFFKQMGWHSLLDNVYGDTNDALNICDIVPERSTLRNIHEDPVCVPFHVSMSSVASRLSLILQQDSAPFHHS